jgi:protein PhnA
MSEPACPMCEMTELLKHPDKWECVTCGHEWECEAAPETAPGERIVKDAHGSEVLKGGSKSKPIRLVDGDHEISCKVNGIAVGLKACFVKKA